MRRRQYQDQDIDPDEIFLDASNLPDFNTQQFEGVLERPISRRALVLLGFGFLAIALIYVWRIGDLQLVKGESFSTRSENNRLKHIPVFAARGVVYDRNGDTLAWNEPGEEGTFPSRVYAETSGIGHVLGYVKPPKIDSNGFYYQEKFEGIDGIEFAYDNLLNGENGIKLIETDALLNITSENVLSPARDGEDLTLTIDTAVSEKLYESIKSLSAERNFEGGAGVIMDVESGEILALSSFPEYSPQVLTLGENTNAIAQYNSDTRNPFLNKIVSGLYTPGSTFKPFVAIGALAEGVIDAEKRILSTGSISVANPYFPDLETVFVDWKAHGWVNLGEALAVSSNVYFYEVAGGYEDQKGIGIENVEKYARLFGLGELTGTDILGEVEGIIPSQEWKEENFEGDPWRVGDTYHTAIGQYGVQVTPLQMVRGIAAIANSGTLVTPHVLRGIKTEEEDIKLSEEYFSAVQKGLRMAVTEGTGAGLNVASVHVAAKTGTAEVGTTKKLVNSWVVGFFPYENPKYAFAVVMEKGPAKNTIGGLFVMRQLIDWMAVNKPEYLEK